MMPCDRVSCDRVSCDRVSCDRVSCDRVSCTNNFTRELFTSSYFIFILTLMVRGRLPQNTPLPSSIEDIPAMAPTLDKPE